MPTIPSAVKPERLAKATLGEYKRIRHKHFSTRERTYENFAIVNRLVPVAGVVLAAGAARSGAGAAGLAPVLAVSLARHLHRRHLRIDSRPPFPACPTPRPSLSRLEKRVAGVRKPCTLARPRPNRVPILTPFGVAAPPIRRYILCLLAVAENQPGKIETA